MKSTQLIPPNFTPTMGAYSHGILTRTADTDFVFVTGQIAVDASGKVVSEDVTVQAEFVFNNIKQILEQAHATFDDVVKVQIFLTDIADFHKITPIRNKYFANSRPVSTLLQVSALVVPQCRIEIEVIAAKPRTDH